MPSDIPRSISTSTNTTTPTRTWIERPYRTRKQHHHDRTYKCLVVHSEYDCGHTVAQNIRDPRCWKCQEIQPRFCRLTDWDIDADGPCPPCDRMKRGEELERQRRLA